MSTMYDALKKAEAGRKAENDPSSGQGGGPSSVTGSVAILLAVILAGIIGWDLYRSHAAPVPVPKSAENRTGGVKAVSKAPAGPAAVKPAAPALTVKYPPGTYTLEGVINADADSIAVINGRLLKVGETIDDLAVRKVSPSEVELLKAGDKSTVILNIRP